jgi:ribosomal protein S27E
VSTIASCCRSRPAVSNPTDTCRRMQQPHTQAEGFTIGCHACRYALVQPVPGRSQLKLVDEGLSLLRGIRTQIAPVVVIGPYRSGKSFLLNQLLGVKCGGCASKGVSKQWRGHHSGTTVSDTSPASSTPRHVACSTRDSFNSSSQVTWPLPLPRSVSVLQGQASTQLLPCT